MQSIKHITSRETFPVRHPVLRPGRPVESCIFEGDDLDTTVHFGLYEDALLVAILSVFEAESPLFSEQNQFQLRGMAVLEPHQRKGLGEKLVHAAEDYIAEKDGRLIWFNAREVAVGFYKKMGYHITGNPFDIAGVGTHYVMYKTLD